MKTLKCLLAKFNAFAGPGALTVFFSLLLAGQQVMAQPSLSEKFLSPPEVAKPRGYWIWAHGNFDYATIKSELKAFKEMGMGGADIFDMGIRDPYDIIPAGNTFMGDEMMDGIAFALNEAKKLNLSMGLSVSNGWNAGGDWTPPEEKLMRLLFWQDTVQGPIRISEIGFPDIPTTFEKPYGTFELFPQIDEEGFPEFYENVALVAFPLLENNRVADREDIQYFDVDKIKGNQISLDLPAGKWVLTRAVVTPLGQKMWVRSDNSNGFIMDHYSKAATKHHFEHIIGKLEGRMGDLGKSALERLYLASFEAEDYVIWSPELRNEFYEQHGYHIDPYLPVFAGQKIGSKERTDRFLYDYRSTVSEMFVNNHYKQASNICRSHGVLLASESGGPGPPLHYVPTEDLKALGAVDIMRGEFWNTREGWRDKNGNDLMQVVKNIGSAAHIYGHKIVEMESFTSRNHWQESPFELKGLADRAFCEGMTRVVYHTMPHSPPESGVPGWSYGAGTHIHPKMTWWPMSRPFHLYLARCGAMLMEGHFVADVAYYYGSEIPNFATTKYVRPDLGPGHDYDDLNDEILLQITEVRNGKIVLPGGMQYEVLVLPDDHRMKLEVLEKVEELLQKGATIIGPRPSKVYGLSNYEEKEVKLNSIAAKIWGSSKRWKRTNKKYGEGRIIWGTKTRQVLAEKGIFPDLTYPGQADRPVLDYLHRTTGQEEIYFIRNTDSTAINLEVSFRVQGLQPERWDPVSGSMDPIAVFREDERGVQLPLQMEGLGSTFIVFSKPDKQRKHIEIVSLNGNKIFPSEDGTVDFCVEYNNAGALVLTAQIPGLYKLTLSDGQIESVNVLGEMMTKVLDRSWDVRFPYGWGVEPLQQFDVLMDWTESSDPELKHFSGMATYRTAFTMESNELNKATRYVLDLGRVGEVARVYLNGEELGVSLFPPRCLEVTHSLVTGENHLVIEVANTWRNRLIGDKDKPLDKQYTRSNVGSENDTSNRPWSELSPLPSGLMGPVRLIGQEIIEVWKP